MHSYHEYVLLGAQCDHTATIYIATFPHRYDLYSLSWLQLESQKIDKYKRLQQDNPHDRVIYGRDEIVI